MASTIRQIHQLVRAEPGEGASFGRGVPGEPRIYPVRFWAVVEREFADGNRTHPEITRTCRIEGFIVPVEDTTVLPAESLDNFIGYRFADVRGEDDGKSKTDQT